MFYSLVVLFFLQDRSGSFQNKQHRKNDNDADCCKYFDHAMLLVKCSSVHKFSCKKRLRSIGKPHFFEHIAAQILSICPISVY